MAMLLLRGRALCLNPCNFQEQAISRPAVSIYNSIAPFHNNKQLETKLTWLRKTILLLLDSTIHVVTNNQVGFTADPWQSRSTLYSSDIGKAFEAPVFHVNADSPDDVVAAFEIATEYRQKFGTDVIIDVIGYRKRGHNEIDEPRFTQPVMYQKIDKHPTCLEIYKQQLLSDGVVTEADIKNTSGLVQKCFDDAFEAADSYVPSDEIEYDDPWKDYVRPTVHSPIRTTGVPMETLEKIGNVLGHVPDDFNMHRRLKNVIKAKEKTLSEQADLDWGTCEALAFGSLLLEGTHVRISGQDVQRGTFSHRHAIWHDQKRTSYTHH